MERAKWRLRRIQRSDKWNLSYQSYTCQIRTGFNDGSRIIRGHLTELPERPVIPCFQLDPEAERNKDGLSNVMLFGQRVYGLASR